MRFIGAKYDPWPQLRLEYIHGGSLEDKGDIPVNECVRMLCQCLSALVYLHERKGIVHRDIKPANILVEYLDTGNIYKFADFGLSRESPDPTTICGSLRYLAPEVFKEIDRRNADHRKKRSYTPAVDIWSLGVVVFECAYDIPCGKAVGTVWCEEIVKKLNNDLKKRPDNLKQFLSTNMVIIDPDLRGSAQHSYSQALHLTDPTEDHSQTPTPASCLQDYQRIHNHVPNEDGGDQQALSYQGARVPINLDKPRFSMEDDTIASAEIQRYIRSSGSPPEPHASTSATTRKIVKRVSKFSSSSNRRHTKRREQPAPSSSRRDQEESKLDAGYYHENWLRDPLYVGSSIAALGQEISDWSRSATEISGTYDQRTMLETLDTRKNEVPGPLLQDWLEEPNRAEPLQWNLRPIVTSGKEHGYDYGSDFRNGNASAPGTYLADPAQGPGEGEQVLDSALNDSEAYLAATLLQTMRQAT